MPFISIDAPDELLAFAAEAALKIRERFLRSIWIATQREPLVHTDPHYPKAVAKVWGTAFHINVKIETLNDPAR